MFETGRLKNGAYLVMGVCDLVRLLWSKADVYDGPQHCTLQYGPDLVLLGISNLVRFTPIWSDLVRFGPIW